MSDFKHSREWRMGDTAQQLWAEILRQRGNAVLPAYAFEDVVYSVKAPVMLVPGATELRITPDVLSFGDQVIWHEVKAKSVPSWYRKLGRWEHGVDYSAAREYRHVQQESKCPVYMVVHELASPMNSYEDSPFRASGIWLFISLNNAFQYGEHRPLWPKRKGNNHDAGRNGQGGLLWPRLRMKQMKE